MYLYRFPMYMYIVFPRTYARVCSRMLTYAHVYIYIIHTHTCIYIGFLCICISSSPGLMLAYAHVCSRMLTYAHVCSRMLTYLAPGRDATARRAAYVSVRQHTRLLLTYACVFSTRTGGSNATAATARREASRTAAAWRRLHSSSRRVC
jgi:hypothetical protein